MRITVIPDGPDNCRVELSADGLPGMHPREHVVMRGMLETIERGGEITDIAPYLRRYGNPGTVIPEATVSGPKLTILMGPRV